MKFKFLKRSESEKSNIIKVIFEVEGDTSGVFALKKGEEYEISPFKPLFPEHDLTHVQKVAEAVRLLSEAQGGICEAPQATLDLTPKGEKGDGKCATCAYWSRPVDPEEFREQVGNCSNIKSQSLGAVTRIYQFCELWRDRNEEDKSDNGPEEEIGQDGICEPVAEEVGADHGDIESGSSE